MRKINKFIKVQKTCDLNFDSVDLSGIQLSVSGGRVQTACKGHGIVGRISKL